jgi:hypothetical protein
LSWLCARVRFRYAWTSGVTLSKEHDIVMKKAFALAALIVCTLAPGAAAQNAADPAKMVQMFSVPLKLDGGNMQVIILNDSQRRRLRCGRRVG